MPYLNVDNWNHCQEFLDYLYRLHREEVTSAHREQREREVTQLEELMGMYEQIHQRSYRTRAYNLYAGEAEHSHQHFTETVVEWMNDKKFLEDNSLKYALPVKFDESFAPNLAYAFEYRLKNLTKKKGKYDNFIPEAFLNFWNRLNQPSWQKNLLWLGIAASIVLSGIATVGILPAIPAFGFGFAFFSSMSSFMFGATIGLSVVGVVGYALDTHEKSNRDYGLYRQQKEVKGATNPHLISSIKNYEYKPYKQEHSKSVKHTNANNPLFTIDNDTNSQLPLDENHPNLGRKK